MSEDDNVLELVPDTGKMTEEDIKNLGKPLAGVPDLSEFTYKCVTCQKNNPPLESEVELFLPVLAETKPPHFNKQGVYTPGTRKLIISTRCFPYGHNRILTWDTKHLFDIGI